MGRTTAFLLAIGLMTAACTSTSAGPSGDTLLTTRPAQATTSTTAVPTTTTVPAATTTTSTTSTTVAPSTTTTTTVAGTEVAGDGDGDTVDTLVQLPFTGAEPEAALVALLALLTGLWLVQRSGVWQLRLVRQEERWWRRPGAPSADPGARALWPPNALTPVTDADRRFRHLARTLADRYEVSFLDGVDAYATRWARTLDVTAEGDGGSGDPVARWHADLVREMRRLYGIE